MAELMNLTPHAVNVYDTSGNLLDSFEPSGELARAQKIDHKIGELALGNGGMVDIVRSEFGELTGLPEPREDTFFIVSLVAAQAAKEAGRVTSDLLISSNPVRDEAGRVIGCMNFAQI